MPALMRPVKQLLARLPRPHLPASLTLAPGWSQRQRALRVWAAAGLLMVLRPFWPLRLLPGWCVGLVLLWALLEALRWLWWPRRWR
jgi:hypothetical protein